MSPNNAHTASRREIFSSSPGSAPLPIAAALAPAIATSSTTAPRATAVPDASTRWVSRRIRTSARLSDRLAATLPHTKFDDAFKRYDLSTRWLVMRNGRQWIELVNEPLGSKLRARSPQPLIDLLRHLGDDSVVTAWLTDWADTLNPNKYEGWSYGQAEILNQVLRDRRNADLSVRNQVALTVSMVKAVHRQIQTSSSLIAHCSALLCNSAQEICRPFDRQRLRELLDRAVTNLNSGVWDACLQAADTDPARPARIHAGDGEPAAKRDAVSGWFREMIADLKPADFVIARSCLFDVLEPRVRAVQDPPLASFGDAEEMGDDAIGLRGALHMFYASYASALRPLLGFASAWAAASTSRPGRELSCSLLRPRIRRHAAIVQGEMAWLKSWETGPLTTRLGAEPARTSLACLAGDLARLEPALQRRPVALSVASAAAVPSSGTVPRSIARPALPESKSGR